MPFDPNKDKVLKSWRCDETGLVVSINQYDKSEAKLQIGPRIYIRKGGGESQGKAGRLSMEDFLWLYDIIDEIKEELSRLSAPK
jgi:hypothetical protein